MTTKSRECRSALSKELHSSPYRRMGRHLLFTDWRVTSSEAILPTLPKTAFVDQLNQRFALVTEHLNCHDLSAFDYVCTQISDFANPREVMTLHG